MGKILSHIPGFRTGTRLHMALSGAYYLLSVSMMLVSVSLSLLMLSGPFLLFYSHTAITKYNESKNARALIAVFVSAALCGGSLIGFVTDMAKRQGNTPVEVCASADTATPVVILPDAASPIPGPTPSPSSGFAMEKAVVLGYTGDGIQLQFADESAGEIGLAGVEIDVRTDAGEYMGETIPPGSIVYLERDPGGVDYYVWTEEPRTIDPGEVCGKTLNALLVAKGYAAAASDPGDRYADIFATCQEEARTACIGFWALALETAATSPAPSTPIPAPSPSQEMGEAETPVPEQPPAEPPPSGVCYCGSQNSDVFHLSTCGSASQISPDNLVTYGSREDAIRQGKRPCKKCKP